MTNIELLRKVRDEQAVYCGYKDYNHMYIMLNGNFRDDFVDGVAISYAIAMCNEQKQACLKSALVETYVDGEIIEGRPLDVKGQIVTINRQSILNTINVAE